MAAKFKINIIPDYQYDDEIQFAEFFPVDLAARLKKKAISSFWPAVIAAVVATAVMVTVAVVTGSLSIPGTGIIAAHKGVFAPLVKKLVLAFMGSASFITTFFFSKWMIKRQQEKAEKVFAKDMREDLDSEYFSDLTTPEPLKVSNVKDFVITGYHKQDNLVMLESPESHIQVILPKEDAFLPLKSSRVLNLAGDKVTHYREKDDYFRVLHPNNTEEDLSRLEMFHLHDPAQAQSTQASLLYLQKPAKKSGSPTSYSPIYSVNQSPF